MISRQVSVRLSSIALRPRQDTARQVSLSILLSDTSSAVHESMQGAAGTHARTRLTHGDGRQVSEKLKNTLSTLADFTSAHGTACVIKASPCPDRKRLDVARSIMFVNSFNIDLKRPRRKYDQPVSASQCQMPSFSTSPYHSRQVKRLYMTLFHYIFTTFAVRE